MENKRILDLCGCEQPGDVHDRLGEVFALPEYYGRNWDALWDCLGDFAAGQDECWIEVLGFSRMDAALRRRCAPMLTVFSDLNRSYPCMHFIVHL